MRLPSRQPGTSRRRSPTTRRTPSWRSSRASVSSWRASTRRASPRRPRGRPCPPTAKVSIKGSESLGSADAPVTVVEFTDYQCPYCLKFIQDTFPEAQGAVRRHRQGPLGDPGHAARLPQERPQGRPGRALRGRAGQVLGDAQRPVRQRQAARGREAAKYAQIIGLDAAAFGSCLASDRHLAAIDASAQDAGTVQITGTPTFVVGKAASDYGRG